MSKWSVLCLTLLCCLGLCCLGLSSANAAEPWKELSRQLNSGTPAERLEAAQALGDLGIDAEPAVSALINALTAKEIELQHEAVLALGRIGPAAVEAVPTLMELMKTAKPLVRYSAIETLGSIGPGAKAALSVLEKELKNSDPMVRVAAAAAIASVADRKSDSTQVALAILLSALDDKQASVGTAAIPGLASFGSAAVPGLVPLLKSDSVPTLLAATNTLGLIGRDGSPAVDNLIMLLGNTEPSIRSSAAETLGKVTSTAQAEPVIKALEKTLTDKNPLVRAHAARALGRLGSTAAPAVKELQALLQDKSDLVRRAALWSLGEIGPDAKAAVNDIDALWDDPVASVTIQAAESLARLGPAALPKLTARLASPKFTFLAASGLREQGPAAAEAVPELVKALSAKDVEARREVVLALAQIGPKAKSAIPALLKLAADEGNEVQGTAVYALVMLGEKEKLLPLVRTSIKSKDERLRLVSIWAWIMLGADEQEDLDTLTTALRAGLKLPRPLARQEAIVAIRRLGERGAVLAPDLAKSLDDESPEVRDAALHALAEMGKAAEPALPRLLKMLGDLPDGTERQAVIYVLGRMGPTAITAAPALLKLVRGDDPFVSALSAWSLVQIDSSGTVRELAIPLLIAVLNNSRPKVREEAARMLGNIGQDNKSVREALEKMSDDSHPDVAAAVKEALKKLPKSQ